MAPEEESTLRVENARAHAICEEFRAAATMDRENDQADRLSPPDAMGRARPTGAHIPRGRHARDIMR